jgi:DNA replication factor GINS
MVLDFQKVKDVHLAEKNSNSLTRVEPDFYKQLRDLIEKEKQSLTEKMERSGISLDPTELYAYKNLVTLAKEIVAIRAQKIARMAIADAFAGSEPLLENAVDWEVNLYWDIRKKVERAFQKTVGSSFNLVHVRILTDIPLFVGPDLKEYGPYRAGEEVPLPREVADLLVRKGQAEVIE